jgi:hypothetical protein
VILVAAMNTTASSLNNEADKKAETPFESVLPVRSANELQIEAPLKFVRHVTQLKQELIHKLIWKRGSEQQ